MGSLGEVCLFKISAEHFVVLPSTVKAKLVMSLPELREIQKIGTAASRVLSKMIDPKIMDYAYMLKTNGATEYFNAWHSSKKE